MGKIIFSHKYEDIISAENLLCAWKEFEQDKNKRKDVQEFSRNLMDNILSLHNELTSFIYKHDVYEHFVVSDPKRRDIHKASVRDRLVHRAIYRKLYPFFDKIFIFDSYSCRICKGTHRAIYRFCDFARKVSNNYTKTCWVLKCDIRKFFASIDQNLLLSIVDARITDKRIVNLLSEIIGSFSSTEKDKGLPLGNLTSQLLVNIYMNEFDQFVKHKLKLKYYIRYADDFVILQQNKNELKEILRYIVIFLREKLKLELHPDKVFIKSVASGVDFLGWVNFQKYRVLRTSTKRRMFKKLTEKNIDSYLGMLKHGNGFKLQRKITSIQL